MIRMTKTGGMYIIKQRPRWKDYDWRRDDDTNTDSNTDSLMEAMMNKVSKAFTASEIIGSGSQF